ncbi:protein of unknown function [Micropruina glycogenica]|uniref:Transposase InsH N-terminal domain-containing protein n=1 Tax=Micropruina glycogenica TaxID=75385 RepID=A0A2N9JG38_9ACTN|nr:protein of unknown function [Micropruina glycogenica]SPD86550.1 protein of unknown function [Micropruina glycogenica]
MDSEQPSFADVEYGNRRRVSKREQFLEQMEATIPWQVWIDLIEPYYYLDRPGKTGRKAKPLAMMLRMYLLQVWFNLSDEGVEDAIYDSFAMRRFLGVDFTVEQVPDATTLLHFRHLLEKASLARDCWRRRTTCLSVRVGSCGAARSWTPRSLRHRHRPRTPPVPGTPRCTRPARAISGTSG